MLAQVESGALDDLVSALHKRQRRIQWERLPSKIILLRHGQSEGNVDHSIYATKGDSRLEVRTPPVVWDMNIRTHRSRRASRTCYAWCLPCLDMCPTS